MPARTPLSFAHTFLINLDYYVTTSNRYPMQQHINGAHEVIKAALAVGGDR